MLELSQGYLSRRLVDIDVTGLGLFYTRQKGSDVFGKTDIGLAAEACFCDGYGSFRLIGSVFVDNAR